MRKIIFLIDKCICYKRKMYLFELKNVFVQSSTTCWGSRSLLFINSNRFLRSPRSPISPHQDISISNLYLTTSSADILGQMLVKGKAAKIEIDQSFTMFHICQVFQSHLSTVQISYFWTHLHCHVLLFHSIQDKMWQFQKNTWLKLFQGSCFCAGEGRSKGKVLYCFGEVILLMVILLVILILLVVILVMLILLVILMQQLVILL